MNKLNLQLESHQFFKDIHRDVISVFQKYYKTDTPFSAFSDLEQYTLNTFRWMMRIGDCFETLEHAKVYLTYYRSNKHYKEAGIGRIHHMNYHYFNYAITVVRVMDVALLLTNNVFRLGNPDELCRFGHISENSWVRSTGVDKILKELRSIVKPWREPRNLFIHRGVKMDSQPLNYVEAWDLLRRDDSSISKIISSSKINHLYKLEVSTAVKKFDRTEMKLFDSILELFSQLLPVYNLWNGILKR